MKRFMAWLLAALCAASACAFAEADCADFAGVYDFASGVGAWNTELKLHADGGFEGWFSDTDMGASQLEGTGCDAIVYYCDFSGRLSGLTKLSDWEYAATVAALDEADAVGETHVEDNLLYCAEHAYGLSQGVQVRLYLPGTPRTALPQGFIDWITIRGAEADWEALPFPGLYNLTEDCGFVWNAPLETGPALPALTPDDGQSGWFWSTPEPARIEGPSYPIDGVVVNCKSFVTLRARPAADSESLARAPLGARVTLYSSDAWYDGKRWFVEAGYQGLRGYMCVEYLDASLPGGLSAWMDGREEITGEVRAANTGTDLILRAGPGAGYDDLGVLYGGEALGYLGEARRDGKGVCWYRCSHYGEECWISAKYTVLTTDAGAVYRGERGVF